MSKQITPFELAEIVTALLVKPSLLGELEDLSKHQEFFRDVAEVVANHCGGHVNGVSKPDIAENYLSDQFSTPYVGIATDCDLPTLLNNVWANYDLESYEDSEIEEAKKEALELGIDLGAAPTTDQSNETRKVIRKLFQTNSGDGIEHSFSMVDWCGASNQGEFNATVIIDNQSSIAITDATGEPVIGVMVEIDKGVPALHIDTDGSDILLHIHKAHGGLVLTPDNNNSGFLNAPIDLFSYNESGSLLALPANSELISIQESKAHPAA